MRLFDVLPNFTFNTSERMLNFYLHTWYTRVAFWVAERLRMLGNQEISAKCLLSIEWKRSAQSPFQNRSFLNNSKKCLTKQKLNFSRCALFHLKTGVSFKYFVTECLWKRFLDSNSPQISSNLIYLIILETLKPFTLF